MHYMIIKHIVKRFQSDFHASRLVAAQMSFAGQTGIKLD